MLSGVNMEKSMQGENSLSHPSNFSTYRYKEISFDNICGYPNVVPPKVREKLPRFGGEKLESTSMCKNLLMCWVIMRLTLKM